MRLYVHVISFITYQFAGKQSNLKEMRELGREGLVVVKVGCFPFTSLWKLFEEAGCCSSSLVSNSSSETSLEVVAGRWRSLKVVEGR